MTDQIHDRVAEVLGMEIMDEDDAPFAFDENEVIGPVPLASAIVQVPQSVMEVDNPELPTVTEELIRIEHAEQQLEVLWNRGLSTATQALGELGLMPPVYKARATEAVAELVKAVADLGKHKVDANIKIIELKLKLAAFTKNKPNSGPVMTGNTFVFNREELIRMARSEETKTGPVTDVEPEPVQPDES